MYIGEVTGRVVSTVKTEGLKNIPLLVVQLIEKGRRTRMIVAADSTTICSICWPVCWQGDTATSAW